MDGSLVALLKIYAFHPLQHLEEKFLIVDTACYIEFPLPTMDTLCTVIYILN